MKLVPNWREAWKWLSMHALAILTVAPVVWASLPHDLKGEMPEDFAPWVLAAVAIGGILGRLKDQS